MLQLTPVKPKPSQQKFFSSGCLCASFYILGGSTGIALGENDFLIRYAEVVLSVPQTAKLQFAHLFLSQLLQFTLLLISGFSALGVVLIPGIFYFRGFSFGLLSQALYAQGQMSALILLWKRQWLPEVLLLLLILYAARFAWQVSHKLYKSCFGTGSLSALHGCSKKLFSVWALCLTGGVVVCMLQLLLLHIS